MTTSEHNAKGASDKEIALKLLIYEDAVKSHFRSILQKLGARNRSQAMALLEAHKRSKIELPDLSSGSEC
jgi:DNA-binding NarL/FixJ family response regulator